jgi:carbon monoxide dehydrogenase subunit G
MATIRREVTIATDPATAWDALRDVGALHTRLCPGFVVNTVMEDGARVVTFGNGATARELLVSVDDEERRVVWSAVGGPMTHHNASAQVIADGDRTKFMWIADFLPHEFAPVMAPLIEQGLAVIKKTLERR